MKRKIALVLCAVLSILSLAGCGGEDAQSDLAYVQDKGTMIVGITDYAPMDYRDENGTWIGFDADCANLVAKELGVKAEFLILSDWGQKYYELETKNIDAIWNGLTLSEEVRNNSNPTKAYAKNAQVVIFPKDQAEKYPDVDSIQDLAFAVESGSSAEQLLKDLEIQNVVALQDQTSSVMEVAAGTVDACVVDLTLAKAMTGPGTGFPDLQQGLSLSQEEYGVAFRKDSDLTERVNAILDDLRKDGTLQALADKYGIVLTDE